MSNKSGFPPEAQDVPTITTSVTLTERDSGKVYIVNAADLTVTMPTAANHKGVGYTFFITSTGAGGSVGLTIAPAGTEKFHGKGITAAASKGVINTHATAAEGDRCKVVSDGTDWWCEFTGTWARVA